ncbi:MAG: exopolysaccharide biosynthesis polyprenyl glycosylphosphotransferase [Nitrosospira sp.]|nr:exopolysaccharide biosynthesis polyprenyl glycosylphosphotransferase [Nitrosospira sp.]
MATIASKDTETAIFGKVRRPVKRMEDLVLAGMALALSAPVMVLIAAAIRVTSSGPCLFKQKRHGRDGEAIEIYKFRTMIIHEEENHYTQACKGDNRITRLGKFLRKTSLDELPQLLNVVQGRMSLIGPRPYPCKMDLLYEPKIENYTLRYKVRPGITGWAQVNGLRGEIRVLDEMKRRVEHDLFYIEQWSLWLDFKILMLTVILGFIHPKAY